MPSTRYLWVSILLNIALQAWLFIEAGLYGATIVAFGGLAIILVIFVWMRSRYGCQWCRNRLKMWGIVLSPNSKQGVVYDTSIGVEMKEPLLSREDVNIEQSYPCDRDSHSIDESRVLYQPPINV